MRKKSYKLAVDDVTSQDFGQDDVENITGEDITIIVYDEENNKSTFRRKSEAACIKIPNLPKTSFKEPENRQVTTKIEKPQDPSVVFSLTRQTRNMKQLEQRKCVSLHTLLRNVVSIQNYLAEDYDKVNLQESIFLLNEIICEVLPDISKLMLLKYPKSVKNLLRMRKYVGNLEEWNLGEEEEAKFNKDAATIRNMATSIGNDIIVSSKISKIL